MTYKTPNKNTLFFRVLEFILNYLVDPVADRRQKSDALNPRVARFIRDLDIGAYECLKNAL